MNSGPAWARAVEKSPQNEGFGTPTVGRVPPRVLVLVDPWWTLRDAAKASCLIADLLTTGPTLSREPRRRPVAGATAPSVSVGEAGYCLGGLPAWLIPPMFEFMVGQKYTALTGAAGEY